MENFLSKRNYWTLVREQDLWHFNLRSFPSLLLPQLSPSEAAKTSSLAVTREVWLLWERHWKKKNPQNSQYFFWTCSFLENLSSQGVAIWFYSEKKVLTPKALPKQQQPASKMLMAVTSLGENKRLAGNLKGNPEKLDNNRDFEKLQQVPRDLQICEHEWWGCAHARERWRKW